MQRPALPLLVLLANACTPVGPREAAVQERPASLATRVLDAAPAEHLTDVVQVVSAGDASCALTSVGAVYCWGLLAESNEGPAFVPLFGKYQARPLEVAGPKGARHGTAVRLGLLEGSLAAIDPSGKLLLAGDFGVSVLADDAPPPQDDPFMRTSDVVALLTTHPDAAFRRKTDGRLRTRRLIPVGPRGVETLLVDAQVDGHCWLGDDAVLHCASDRYGRSGRSAALPPGFVDEDSLVCRADEGELTCIPAREHVLNPTNLQRCSFRAQSVECSRRTLSSARPIRALPGPDNGCVLLEDGSTDCFRQPRGPYVDVTFGFATRQVCAARRDGLVECAPWTRREDIQPTPVPGAEGIVQLSSGKNHACGLRDDGRVACWGLNFGGQLGSGTTARDDAPGDPVQGRIFEAGLVVAPETPQSPPGTAPRIATRRHRGQWTSAQ